MATSAFVPITLATIVIVLPGENAPHSGCGIHGGCAGAVKTVTARPSLPVTRSCDASVPQSTNAVPTRMSTRTTRFLEGVPSVLKTWITTCAESPAAKGDTPSLSVSGLAVTSIDVDTSDGPDSGGSSI